jgi:predicted alpha/beta-hydrolase family hydrolase
MPPAVDPAAAGPAVLDVPTPHGPARVHVHGVERPAAGLVLGHGANGSLGTPDLTTATRVALDTGVAVALVEQPYKVAGRRSPAPASQLDAAWVVVIEHLRADALRDLPLVVGGRSSGARVACRTAAATGARAVLCLAFPLHPPGRPDKSRQAELDAVAIPTLVIQGDRDPFGIPAPPPTGEVVKVAGDHGLRSDNAAVSSAIGDWLARVVALTAGR